MNTRRRNRFLLRNHNICTRRCGFTCIEVIAAVIALFLPLVLGFVVGHHHGILLGVLTGTGAGAVGGLFVRWFYVCSARRFQQEILELETKYPSVYRILAVPKGLPCVIAAGVEVLPGDYGWEAEPILKDDGRIYLQGLTQEWCVAWYAGFEASQIELICQKPRSQYYLPYSWTCAGAKPSPCPFSVGRSPENNLGFPQRTSFPYIQGIHFDAHQDPA